MSGKLLTFAEYNALGYKRLVPIIPHDADISENSSLYKRVGTKQDGRGKTPGVRGRSGTWHSFDWVQYEIEQHDLIRWQNMGAGIGIMTGEQLLAIDADTLDKTLAGNILMCMVKHFGVLPTRVGQFPKALFLIRLSAPMKYTRVDFGDNERVECLSDGRQFVAQGVHPKTKLPYTWTTPLVPFDQLPIFSPQQVTAFLEELRTILPAAKPIVTEGSTKTVSQASLKGDIETVRKAVKATPNTTEAFPTRENWRDYGYAIKAALPDNEAEAIEIFGEWSERWTENNEPVTPGNSSEYLTAEWRRFKPPFRVGANKIYELAERLNPAAFRNVDRFLDVIPDEPEPLFAIAATAKSISSDYFIEPSAYTFPDPTKIPTREWIYDDHYIRGFLSATVAPGGLGKSSLTIAKALVMASGRPLLGVVPKGQFTVWLWNGEDPREELDRRIAAAMQHFGLTAADIGSRLFVDSGMQLEIILARGTGDGATIAEPVAGALISAFQRKGVDVFVADPFVSSHRVSENDNGAIDQVAKRWSRIAFETRTSIELVHHVRKTNGAEVTVEDARGASSLINATRSARSLTRMTDSEGKILGVIEPWRYFRSGGVSKTNMAPPSGAPADKAIWFTLQSVPLGNGPGEGVEALMSGDAVGVVVRAPLAAMMEAQDPDDLEAALTLLSAGDWRADVRSRDSWCGHPVAKAFGLDASDAGDQVKIKGMLKQWRRDGLIEGEWRADSSRHQREFIKVVAKLVTAPPEPLAGGIFG